MLTNVHRIFLFLIVSLFCVFQSAVSHASTAPASALQSALVKLIRDGRYSEAFTLASQNIVEYGGEPEFDFLLGVAALKAGEYQRAVFAFERVLVINPKKEIARFNLATAYYHIDNLAAAKKEFMLLSSSTKEVSLIIGTKKYLALIEQIEKNRRTSLTQVVSVTLGYNNNINNGGSLDEFYHPLLSQPIQLSDDGKAKSDRVAFFNYQLHYQKAINQRRSLLGSVVLSHMDLGDNDNKKYQSTVAQISGELQGTRSNGRPYQIGVYYTPLWLGGNSYRKQYGVDANTSWALANLYTLGVQLGLGKTSNDDNQALNSLDVHLGSNLQYQRGRWLHLVSGNFSDIRTTHSNSQYNAYELLSLQYLAGFTLTRRQQATLKLQSLTYSYQDAHPFWLKKRDDNVLSVGLGWQYIAKNGFVWQVNGRFLKKDSNIPLYRYRKNDITLGFSTVI